MSGRKRERGAGVLVNLACRLLATGLEALASRLRAHAPAAAGSAIARSVPGPLVSPSPITMPAGELADLAPPTVLDAITFDTWFVAAVDEQLMVKRIVGGQFENRLAALPFLRWQRNRGDAAVRLVHERVYRGVMSD